MPPQKSQHRLAADRLFKRCVKRVALLVIVNAKRAWETTPVAFFRYIPCNGQCGVAACRRPTWRRLAARREHYSSDTDNIACMDRGVKPRFSGCGLYKPPASSAQPSGNSLQIISECAGLDHLEATSLGVVS